MIREICKAGWLQQKIEKRSGAAVWSKKMIFLPEKWYVLCVHDDKSPFLEVYLNDEGVSQHKPLETMNLNECQYLSTAIEDDRTFVIAFHEQGRSSLELAALSELERREWMEMLRFKLTRLGCLESGSNIYSPFPVNTSIAPVVSTGIINENSNVNLLPISSTTTNDIAEHTYEPPRRSVIVENVVANIEPTMPPIQRLQYDESLYEPIAHVPRSNTHSPTIIHENIEEERRRSIEESAVTPPSQHSFPRYSRIQREERPVLPPRNLHGTGNWSTSVTPNMDVTHRRTTSNHSEGSPSALYDVPRSLFSPLEALAASPPKTPSSILNGNIERYDPLPFDREVFRLSTEETSLATAAASAVDSSNATTNTQATNGIPPLPTSFSFDNAGFDEDDESRRHYANGPLMSSASDLNFHDGDQRGPYSALPTRARMVPWSVLNTKSITNGNRAHSNSPFSNMESSSGRNRSQSVTTIASSTSTITVGPSTGPYRDSRTPSPPTSPPPAPPLPLPNQFSIPIGSGRVMPLKETEVERLRSDMESPLLVKAKLRLEDVVNENGQLMGLALVDLMGCVWIAGWLKRFTKQFSSGLHIGDRLDSILDADGRAVAISNTAKAEQVLKDCWKKRCHEISLFIKRLPLAQVYVLKRAENGDHVGISLKAGKNEIIAIEEGKAASKAGMRVQCKSTLNNSDGLVNYFITEVNGRPLNMFSRENEAQKRLNAVGIEMSILVQPSDFVKELRKKLKHKKGYKDYVIG